MSNNSNIHHRQSIRLHGYDYSKSGLYFITINCEDRECFFGKILNKKMFVNKAGNMIECEWLKLTNRFKNISLHEYCVMPNHFHGILEIMPTERERFVFVPQNINDEGVAATLVVAPQNKDNELVRATLVVAPDNPNDESANLVVATDNSNANSNDVRATTRVALTIDTSDTTGQPQGLPQQVGIENSSRKTIGDMMDAFKSITTVEYIRGVKKMGWKRFNGKMWQRNYYEHIIRNEEGYKNITQYINNNPENWEEDKFYVQ